MEERGMNNWRARFEFKLADMWVGLFWRKQPRRLDVWVCAVPCLPLHIWYDVANGDA